MHPISLLRGWLLGNCHDIHRARIGALCRLVAGLLRRGTLTLTDLGRAMPGALHTKAKIKCVDRLLGNRRLHAERASLYRAMADWLIPGLRRPVILVDWSDCTAGHRWLVLKAAVAVRGRAVTVYEEVHPLSRYNNPGVHRRFLRRLADVLPAGCTPVVVTDAGFRGPWLPQILPWVRGRDIGWEPNAHFAPRRDRRRNDLIENDERAFPELLALRWCGAIATHQGAAGDAGYGVGGLRPLALRWRRA